MYGQVLLLRRKMKIRKNRTKSFIAELPTQPADKVYNSTEKSVRLFYKE